MSTTNPATQGPEEEIRRLRARLAELLEQGRPDVASDDDGPALQAEEHDRIEGGGELGALIRSHDWSKTILGPMSTWPQSLKTSLRTMLHSRYPMFVWWGRELINFYNDAYIPILGKRHPWALGLPSADVWTEIWSEVGRQAAIVLNEGKATWNEQLLLVMRRYGYTEEAYFTFSYSPLFDDRGEVGGVFCAVTEDTERVLSERRLRALRQIAAQTANARTAREACQRSAEALGDHPKDVAFALIYLFEGEDRARLVSSTGLGSDSGFAPELVRVGERSAPWPAGEILQGRSAVRRDLGTSRLPGGAWPEPARTAMVLPLTKGGQERPRGFLVVGASPRREFDDRYREFFELLAGSVATAVANAQAYEEETKRAEALAELDRAKTAFFSNVSHEFRTPLTLLLGPLEELLAKKGAAGLEPGDWGQLELAHRNSVRLLRLVNNLLDFSRIEAGRVEAVYEAVDLAQLTRDLASGFRSAIERAGLRLVVDCPHLAEPVYVDRAMWEKIVLNLISNAFKFTFRGQIAVSLRSDGSHVELRIEDTGIGVPEAQLPRLFDRFHRVEGARGRTHEGSGIGLALVQELVKLHGGAVTAQSLPGGGTTFSVRLPLGTAHLPSEKIGARESQASTALRTDAYVEEALQWLPHEEKAAAKAEDPGPQHTAGGRILLADDNTDMREYVRRLLGERYTVQAVPDGSAALEAILENPPDLVLTDIMMPGLNGFELLRAIRGNPQTSTLPVILLSARAGEESRVEGLEHGADDYLVKPFTARELMARVASHLEMSRIRREAEDRFRRLYAANVVGILSTNQERILEANDAFLNMIGFTREDLDAGRLRWKELTPPEYLRLDEEAIAELLATGSCKPFKKECLRKDGSRVPILLGATLLERSPARWLCIVMDLSEQKRTEEALRRSERLYRAIGESIDYGVWLSSPEGRNIFASESLLHLLGMTQEECSDFGWAKVLHPDDAARTMGSWQECVRTMTAWEDKHRLLGRDGKWHPILARGVPVRDDRGEIIYWAGINLDISGLQQVEDALRESERQARARATELEAIMDAVPIATLVARDPDCRYIMGSRMTYELFRVPSGGNLSRSAPEGELATTFQAMKDGAEIPRHELPLQTAARTGQPVRDYEFDLVLGDGTVRNLLGNAVPLRGEDDCVQGAVGGFLDITERKQFEKILRDSEDRFRTLADSIPQLTWMTNETGFIVWYNRRWYDYTGTTLEEMQGRGWERVHHPDHVQRVVDHFWQCMDAGTVWEDTFPLRGKNGEYRWFLSRAVPIRDSAGQILRWFGTNTDITERLAAEERIRTSEEHFRRLYEANIVGIASADCEMVFEANDLFLKMIGYSREELAASRIRWRDFTPAEYAHLDQRGIEELIATGSCKPFEKEYFRRDGSRVPVLICATLLDRAPLRWLCFVVDLTERKELERRLFEKQKLESIGLLAGGIAHDFNNLLVGILGNASLAQDMLPLSSPVAGLLSEVVNASERAAHLTRQMLAYSGKGRFVIEAVNLSDMVQEMTRLLQPSIPKKVALHMELDRNVPSVEADAGQLQQVIMNLVLNAAEAIGDNAGSISIRTGVRNVDERYIRELLRNAEIEPGTYVWLEVRDTGCGMDDATMARIFDPFFTTKFTGRGLGLAAVAGIVRGHKGAIRVSSMPGSGSTFLVMFAAVAVPAEQVARVPMQAELHGAGTVLVVDDEAVVLRVAKLALQRHGYRVLEADSGPAAIEIMKREGSRISAVVLDLSMPGMSGHEALPRLREIRPDLEVIVSSGYSEAETMRFFSGQTLSGFIQKPYTSMRLAEALKGILRQK